MLIALFIQLFCRFEIFFKIKPSRSLRLLCAGRVIGGERRGRQAFERRLLLDLLLRLGTLFSEAKMYLQFHSGLN